MTPLLTALLSTAPDGREMFTVNGMMLILPRGCHIRPMGFWTRHLLPTKYIGFTTSRAVHFRESTLAEVTAETVCHEVVHWWQANRRMGPLSYDLTYLWHLVITAVFRWQWGHWWGQHPMERQAIVTARGMMGVAAPAPAFDLESILATFLPEIR